MQIFDYLNIKMTLPDYKQLTNRLKLLAHPERLRILDVLRREPECVCHLEALLNKPQPYVSQQLRVLRQAGIIQDEKEGHNVFYRLADSEIAAWLNQILGPVQGEHPEIAHHKRLISCGCPKCDSTGDIPSLADKTA
ncbi:MAG: transcriptional regulator [Chloroflexi bacterium]|nr:MAG: transcriptional regulator [Chloroflexota bacterium]